jgi:N-methylhydantoinase A
VTELSAAARTALGTPHAAISTTYELRYRGQAYELAIAGPADAEPSWLRESFEAAHEERYGYRDREQEIELVTVRVSATVPGPDLRAAADAPAGAPSAHPGAGAVAPLAPGTALAGPLAVPLGESTLWIPAGWHGTVAADGALHVRPAEAAQ